MGLASDYNIYRDHAAMSCVIHTGGNVLHGAGSLEMKYVSAGGNVAAIRKNSPRNFVSGRVRFLLSRSLFGSQLTGPRPGFLFNLSAEDVTGSSGTGYLFTLERTGGNNTYTPTFFRLTAGMNTMTSLVTATAFVVGLAPTSVPLEATWKLDVENLGGMSLSCRRGVAANYGGSTLNWATILTINHKRYHRLYRHGIPVCVTRGRPCATRRGKSGQGRFLL